MSGGLGPMGATDSIVTDAAAVTNAIKARFKCGDIGGIPEKLM